MKNNRNVQLILSILCFLFSVFCAIAYAVFENRNIRILSAIGFTACFVVFFKMFMEYLKNIGFGRKIFKRFQNFFIKISKAIRETFIGKDEDKVYVTGKKDEFQIKFELFKKPADKKEKKAVPKLPKYSSLKSEKEKIRYIYTVFLKNKIARGYRLDSSHTPKEIGKELGGNEKTDMLFTLYPVARYASDSENIDIESVKTLEDIL